MALDVTRNTMSIETARGLSTGSPKLQQMMQKHSIESRVERGTDEAGKAAIDSLRAQVDSATRLERSTNDTVSLAQLVASLSAGQADLQAQQSQLTEPPDAQGKGLTVRAADANAQQGGVLIDSDKKANGEGRDRFDDAQRRFDSAVSSLRSMRDSMKSAQSRITDASVANEASALAANQVLTQSGNAMLAQANQMSQNVLGLLR